MTSEKLRKKAKKKLNILQKQRRDKRFLNTVATLSWAKLLDVPNVKPYKVRLALSDVLWAGEIEPRILELVPGILIKKPSLIDVDHMPADLKEILKGIRKGKATKPFRKVPASLYMKWVKKIGHTGKEPSLLKTFRFSQEDLKLMENLRSKHPGESDINLIRIALKKAAA